jgi:PII-like signaling protein
LQEFAGERVLMRIHIGEADRYKGHLLYKAILKLLREQSFAGATVFRGAMSLGASSIVHTDTVEVMALDLPVVIECVETEENIRRILPELDEMIGGGLITLEQADVILYRPHTSVSG